MNTIPSEILAQHIAVLGKTGSGKTSTAKLAIEQVVAAGARVCILDPIKSDWWGLTSSRDGKRGGLPFHILGGPHGHVPLHSSAGKAIAEVVANGALPLSILDMADFEPGGLAKFFVDFAPVLLKKMRGVIYLVLEEAHLFAPKERGGVGDENMSVYYAKLLATAGRSKGIRLLLVTQRVQALHNALLGSADTMIAHRMTAPADQEPVVKWLKANTTPDVMRRVAGELASLKTGDGWVCSGEARIFSRVHFDRIATYDNTATPTGDVAARHVTTAAIDQDKLRAIIGHAVEEAKANDPKELKRRVVELERELAAAKRAQPAPAAAPERVEVSVLTDEDRKMLAAIGLTVDEASDFLAKINLAPVLAEMARTLGSIREPLIALARRVNVAAAPPRVTAAAAPSRPSRPRVEPSASGDAAGDLTGPERRILNACAWLESLGQDAPKQVAVAFLAGYTFNAGAWNNPRGSLRTKGLVAYAGDALRLTDAGRALAEYPDTALTTATLHERVLARLPTPEQRVLAPLLERYPDMIGVDESARLAGYTPGVGAYNNPRGRLRSLGLVDYPQPGFVRAAAALFLDERAA